MTRKYTSLPHKEIYYGKQWDGQNGNFDPNKKPVTTIVLHSSAGGLQGSIARLSNPQSKVSCNYIIDTDGTIYGMVPEDLVAYTNGSYQSNQESITIEHVDNNDIANSRTDSLYNSSARLIADISRFYSIPLDTIHIKLHSEIVATRCPNGLDRDRLISMAKELSGKPTAFVSLASDVFERLVTKSTELDSLWNALNLDVPSEARPGSHKLVLDYIDAKVSEARNQAAPSVEASPVLTSTPAQEVLTDQSKPLLQKDLTTIFSEFLAFLGLKKQS